MRRRVYGSARIAIATPDCGSSREANDGNRYEPEPVENFIPERRSDYVH